MPTGNGSQAAIASSQSSIPTLWLPATTSKGIIKRRVVNIPSSQENLLQSDAAWLDSSGLPGHDYKPMPDKLLKRLQKAMQKRRQVSSAPSKKPPLSQEVPVGRTNIQTAPVATKDLKTAVESQTVKSALPTKYNAVTAVAALTPNVARAPAQTATQAKQAYLAQITTKLAEEPITTSVRATPKQTTPKQTPASRRLAVQEAARAVTITGESAPLASSATKTQTPAKDASRPINVGSDSAVTTTQRQVASVTKPDPLDGKDVSRPALPALTQKTSPPLPPPPPATLEKAKTQTATVQTAVVQTAIVQTTVVQTVEEEPEAEEEAEEEQQHPGELRRSPSWPDQLASDDYNSDNEASDEDGEFIDGSDNVDVHDSKLARRPQEIEIQQKVQQQQQQQLPNAASTLPALDPKKFPQANIAYSSSPAAMDVEVPNALGERRSSVVSRDGQDLSSRVVQPPPNSSPPPPGTPAAMLRRLNRQSSSHAANGTETSLAAKPVGDASLSPQLAAVDTAAPQKAVRPRRRLMKAPVFPASSTVSSLKARPSMADLRSNSAHASRRSSLASLSTGGQYSSPMRTPALERVRAKPRAADVGDMSRRETSIPLVAAAPALESPSLSAARLVSAHREPRPLEESRNAPLPIFQTVVSSPAASTAVKDAPAPRPMSPVLQTWMLPYEAFVAAYPDYKGDLEDFLRACYALQHTGAGALPPSFLFDDVIHAFLDYIEYIHEARFADAQPPQNLAHWYNLHATGLICKKSVVTRDNVASILRAYPDEVRAIAQNAVVPSKAAAASVVEGVSAAAVNGTTPGQTLLADEQPEDPTPFYQSFPPGRPFHNTENQHTSSQVTSSGRPNSILQVLQDFRGSNSTNEGGLRHGQGRMESPPLHGVFGGDYNDCDISLDHSVSQGLSSQDPGLGYTQDGRNSPLGQTRHLFEATQSSRLEEADQGLSEVQSSSPIPSVLLPLDINKQIGITQSSAELQRQRQSPIPGEPVVHRELVEETPAKHMVISQKRSRRVSKSTLLAPPTAVDANGAPKTKVRPVMASHSSPRHEVVENANADDDATFDDARAQGARAEEHDDAELYDTTIMSAQSAVESSWRLSPKPPPTKRSAAMQQERRRITIAASDIGMVARMAAAEEVERVAPKRKLPKSMVRPGKCKSADPAASSEPVAAPPAYVATPVTGEPPKKKKKKSGHRQSTGGDLALSASERFRKFLEKKVAEGLSEEC